jgi:prolipoprotein diacylglyceryltransferase
MRTGVFRVVLLALLLLALMLLVPSATPVDIGGGIAIGPFRLTGYGVFVAVGALAASVFTLWLGLRRKFDLRTALGGILCAVLGTLIGARIVYSAAMIESIAVDFGLAFIPQLWKGGYTLYGGVLGGMTGAALYARVGKQKFAPLLDLLAPGAALFLAVARLAEIFTAQGLGYYVFNEAFQWFPFAVPDSYGYWYAPVFFYEALAALLIAFFCARALPGAKPGRPTLLFLALLSLSQILLDSWRHDEYIRFGFVHFNQLAAVATLGILLIVSVCRRVRQAGWNAWQIVRSTLFVLLVGVLIWVEFALDKSNIDNIILYLVMAAALTAMGFTVLYDGRRPETGTITQRSEKR